MRLKSIGYVFSSIISDQTLWAEVAKSARQNVQVRVLGFSTHVGFPLHPTTSILTETVSSADKSAKRVRLMRSLLQSISRCCKTTTSVQGYRLT